MSDRLTAVLEAFRLPDPRQVGVFDDSPEALQLAEHRRRTYGLERGDFFRILAEQEYGCAICRREINERTGNVDHDHKTGLMRGILCSACNSGLGLLGDTLESLQRAVRYLGG